MTREELLQRLEAISNSVRWGTDTQDACEQIEALYLDIETKGVTD